MIQLWKKKLQILIQTSVSGVLAIKKFAGHKKLVNINTGGGIDAKPGGNLYYIEIQGINNYIRTCR